MSNIAFSSEETSQTKLRTESDTENSIDPKSMLSVIDSDDYYNLLKEACSISPATYKLVKEAYDKLFNLDQIEAKYKNFLIEKSIPNLLRYANDDRLQQFDPDDEGSVTGLTVGQWYVRENLYHIVHNLSRLLVNDAFLPILFAGGLLLQQILHPRWLQSVRETDDEQGTEVSPIPASQIAAIVEWVQEILNLCDEAVRGLPLTITPQLAVDERVETLWNDLGFLAQRNSGKSVLTSDTSSSNDASDSYPIPKGCAWDEDICTNIIEINRVLMNKVKGIYATGEETTEVGWITSSSPAVSTTKPRTESKRNLDQALSGTESTINNKQSKTETATTN